MPLNWGIGNSWKRCGAADAPKSGRFAQAQRPELHQLSRIQALHLAKRGCR